MIYAYTTNTTQTLLTGANVSFNSVSIDNCCSETIVAGGETITLNKPGYYLINFNADAAEADAAGNISFQLYTNEQPVPGAKATAYSGAVTSVVNLKFSVIIKILPSCCAVVNSPQSYVIKNTGVGSSVTNAAITVVKL